MAKTVKKKTSKKVSKKSIKKSIKKNHVGRPQKYTPDIPEKLLDYFIRGYKEDGRSMPSLLRFCSVIIGITTETFYQWIQDPNKKELSDTYKRAREIREDEILNGGASENINPSFAQFLLVNEFKNDYANKQEIKQEVKADVTATSIESFFTKNGEQNA